MDAEHAVGILINRKAGCPSEMVIARKRAPNQRSHPLIQTEHRGEAFDSLTWSRAVPIVGTAPIFSMACYRHVNQCPIDVQYTHIDMPVFVPLALWTTGTKTSSRSPMQ
jgi:hypothetical protein